MPGKARVHELAKELGVTSKVVLAKLNELGEYVKSPSSTVEPPVARKLREAMPPAAPKKTPAKAAARAAAPAPPPVQVVDSGALSASIPAPTPTPAPVHVAEPVPAAEPAPAYERPAASVAPAAAATPADAPAAPRPAAPRVGNNPFGVTAIPRRPRVRVPPRARVRQPPAAFPVRVDRRACRRVRAAALVRTRA